MSRPQRSPIGLLVLPLLVFAAVHTAAFAQPINVLIVLDASGSMYLKLDDGQYRITAAKDALSQFVARLPDAPDLNVGLRVYGANLVAVEEGACEDSELVEPVTGFDRDGLMQTIRDTQPKGATPIAYSLELAADDLREAEGRKVIVLVTDGAESCGGDLRAAVERLTAEGFDVDVRIIGFALSDFAIASFDGLGRFESTNSAAELADALARAADVAPSDHLVTVRLARGGEPVTQGASVRFVDAVDGSSSALGLQADGSFTAELPAGNYRAVIDDATVPTSLTVGGLPVTPDGDNTFTFELDTVEVVLTVDPTDPLAGATVEVAFQGAPGVGGSFLTIVPTDAGDDVVLDRVPVSGASGLGQVRTPGEPGELEARYHARVAEGGTRVVGRSPAFASLPIEASVNAPDEIPAGTTFDVPWQGPNNDGDYLTIVPTGTRDGTRAGNWTATNRGNPATLTAPAEPGQYEVRYILREGHTTIARVVVTVR